MQVILLLLFTSSIIWNVESQSVSWNYGNRGPNFWKRAFPLCAGNAQSPIDIKPKATVFTGTLRPFHKSLFTKPLRNVKIWNNGHTVEVDLTNAWTLPLGEGGLFNSYKSLQCHFHWAKKGQSGGSEHTVNGKHAWGEMHVVHHNTWFSPKDASSRPKGLAVLAFFIEVNGNQNNPGLNKITSWIKGKRFKSDQGRIPTFPFLSLISKVNMRDYYRYKGSLTTPTCNQVVEWTVFKEPIRISKQQARYFQEYLFTNTRAANTGERLAGNFRNTQALNSRTIYRSFPNV